MGTLIMLAGVYQHYKGGFYQVLGVADDSDTGAPTVVYVSLTGAHFPGRRLRVRLLDLWEKPHILPDGGVQARYIFVGDSIPQSRPQAPPQNLVTQEHPDENGEVRRGAMNCNPHELL